MRAPTGLPPDSTVAEVGRFLREEPLDGSTKGAELCQQPNALLRTLELILKIDRRIPLFYCREEISHSRKVLLPQAGEFAR